MKSLFVNGKCLFLAYDQGLEHGPTDFNDENIDPRYIIGLAREGKFSALILQKGIAEHYRAEIKKAEVPLILKLNGKTNLNNGEPVSTQLCTLKEALKLGAIAVGYTIYIGSRYERQMLKEFELIEREAHAKHIPVIAWIYPRGKSIKNVSERDLLAYSARAGLELGADIVKLHWNGNQKDLEWAVRAAGKCKVVVAGGTKKDELEFLRDVKIAMSAGAAGIAVGRNVWQSKYSLKISEKIREIIWK
jgi:class I fructose-bisphosphate aldolase